MPNWIDRSCALRTMFVLICLTPLASRAEEAPQETGGWVAFNPKPDQFSADSAIDLRVLLNEKQAGDGGFIAAKGSQFVHAKTGEPVRFWAVNGCPGKDTPELKHSARVLAKHGVNLVRIHGGYFDANGNVDPTKIRHAIDIVQACKAEGIYSHFSIYFPIWLEPKPGTPWLDGYKAGQKPFAALYFNSDFQEKYQQWWKALLTTPIDNSGRTLLDEPAVFGAEIINEDSYFFWTFSTGNIPDPQLKILEMQFGERLDRSGDGQVGRCEASARQSRGGASRVSRAVGDGESADAAGQRDRCFSGGEPARFL